MDSFEEVGEELDRSADTAELGQKLLAKTEPRQASPT